MSQSGYGLKVCINGVDISEAVLEMRQKGGLNVNTMTIESTASVILDSTNTRLSSIDLKGIVTFEATSDRQNIRQFTGYIVEGKQDGTNYILECRDPMQVLQEHRTGGGFGTGFFPAELLYYLLCSSTPQHADKKGFQVSPGKSLADLDWLFAPKQYIYVAPIPSCILTQTSIKIGDAYLYRTNGAGFVDDFNIADRLPGETPPEWGPEKTRIRIEIEAESFLDAFEKGRERFRQILDFISFGINLSSPQFIHNSQKHLHDFTRQRMFVNIEETAWDYVGEALRQDRYWLQWRASHLVEESFKIEASDPLLSLRSLFQGLLSKDAEDLSSVERAGLNALHALRQARQSRSPGDALDHVFRSMEYLLKGYRVSGLFTEEERQNLIKAAKAHVTETYSELSNSEQEKRRSRVESVLQNINDASLRTKWQHFCNDKGLLFPKSDETFLWNIRKQRNENQHGRLAKTKRDDIQRAASMVEKAILASLD